MVSTFVAPIRRVIQALLSSNTPSQLAGGFTLGMMIGVVPKSNLIALSLCVLLFSLRCNKGLGLMAAVLFSFAGAWTDPFAHKLGLAALSVPSLQANYASAFSVPFGPWIGFHNTVVIGSLLMSLYFAYPVYWVTKTFCAAMKRGTA
jgi:uncharacterized protein (TIGR03546 family)